MKKFTGKSLLGELSITRILRKVGLSLVVVFWTLATFGQEAQTTLELKAKNLSSCYTDENGFYYEVQVTIRDFIKIDTFVLNLTYDKNVFDFHGVAGVVTDLSTMTVQETTAGSLWFKWGNGAAAPLTIAASNDNEYNAFKIRFRLDGYPHSYGVVNNYVYTSALHWDHANSKHWNEFGQVTHILTDWTTDGTITVTQNYEDVLLTTGAADCAGLLATATVTGPLAGYYSFNGSTFTNNPTASVVAPSTDNTIRVRSGASGGCVSYYKKFDVTAPAALSFTAATPVYTACPGGLGDIEILGFSGKGTAPYTFYCVPKTEWDSHISADLELALTKEQQMAVLAPYTSDYNVFQKQAGKEYYVAVQDANWCAPLRGPNKMSWWRLVSVIDDKDPWDVVYDVTHVTCCGQTDGRIRVTSIDGGTPFAGDKYHLWFNDAYKGKVTTFDSGSILAAGDHTIIIRDSLACEWKKTITITQPDPITFLLGHTDASCNSNIGKIWIVQNSSSPKGGTLPYAHWQVTTDPSWATVTKTMTSINDTAKNLAPGVYYARLFDSKGCFGEYENPVEDNAVKILDIDFDVEIVPIKCHGDETTATIVLKTGGGGHTFEYRMRPWGGAWTPWTSTNTFTIEVSDNPWIWFRFFDFEVHDITLDCTYKWTKKVTQPAYLYAEVVNHATVPPTCPGNSDGKLVVKAMGGTPFVSTGGVEYYKYKMDNNPWVQASNYNTFAIDTARHSIMVEDANGCQWTLMFDWPERDNIIEFQDTIWNICADAEINLFNKHKDQCEYTGGWQWWNHNWWALDKDPTKWDCPDELRMDHGYLDYFEWYGIPNEHFVGTISFEYYFWTSDSGWVTRTIQGIQQQREPMLYIWEGAEEPAAQDIVDLGVMIGHDSSFDAGTYWVVAMDEWGCFSNVEKIVIMDPPALAIEVTPVAAGCFGSIDGMIKIEALNGRFGIPEPWGHGRYQWFLTQQPQIFQRADWLQQVQWWDFTNGDFENDSLAVINAKKGTYWLAVRDWCGIENPDLIQFAGPIVVEGFEAIELDHSIEHYLTHVTCNVYGQTPSNDGTVNIPLAEVSGGNGDYKFKLEKVSSSMTGTWPKINKTGSFTGLWAGTYKLTVMDTFNDSKPNDNTDNPYGCNAVYNLTITQPPQFKLEMDSVFVSCYGEHDGILRYTILGGVAPYKETTNNVGIYENASSIPADRWYSVDNYVSVTGGIVFDRRVREGKYEIYIKDAHNCIYGPVKVEIKQPAKLALTLLNVTGVTCHDDTNITANSDDKNDGTINVMPAGGWNLDDDFLYYVKLWKGSTVVQTATINTLDDVTFSGLDDGNYVVELFEWNPVNPWANPYISYFDYFSKWNDIKEVDDYWYQNPCTGTCTGVTKCVATLNVTVPEPALITYNKEFTDVVCHNTHTGTITVKDIAGGVPDALEGYYVGLEGPFDYKPVAGWDHYTVTAPEDTLFWYETGAGLNSWTFTKLIWGHYTIHVKDGNGCWIYRESLELQNPPLLTLTMQLVENVLCYKTATGWIRVNASGGVGDYEYAVDTVRTYVKDSPDYFEFPLDDPDYLGTLAWQPLPDFKTVPAGVWVGFVRDENGCVAGFAFDRNGQPVLNHRVAVLESTPVVATIVDQISGNGVVDGDKTTCNGASDGEVVYSNVSGGNGARWSARVWGTDVRGNAVDKMYEDLPTSGTLPGLPATYTEGDSNKPTYNVVFYDHEGCPSATYQVAIMQPMEFIVVLKDKQQAFICYNDKAGIFEIDVIQGGTPFNYPVPAGTDPIYKYQWEVFKDAAHTQKVDSLTGVWGFTSTFLGYAGYYYRVWAMDKFNCTTYKDTLVEQPDPVNFEVKNITCHGATKASARIVAWGETGRNFKVRAQRVYETGLGPWSNWSASFGPEIVIDTLFFGNVNEVEGHYNFQVQDNFGCLSGVQFHTFVPVQHALDIPCCPVTVPGECTSTISLSATGGTPPYTWWVDGMQKMVVTFDVSAGGHTVKVMDAHECVKEIVINVPANPVVRNLSFTVDKGLQYHFVDAESGKDLMLSEGTYTYTYTYMGCTRTLNVTIVGVVPQWAISAVQGTGTASPVDGRIGAVTGTVTAVVPGTGFYMQDASTPWSGIYVAYTGTGVLEGNSVKVTGTVDEVNDVTTLIASEVTLLTTPLAITPIDIAAAASAKAEMYESVLIKVTEKTRPTNIATTGWDANGAAGMVKVTTALYAYTPNADHWYVITGVIDGKTNGYILTPRKASDIIDHTQTTGIAPVAELEFKVYPNPFNDRIFIDNASKLTRVVVNNIAGQRVIDVEYPGREIRTANLVSGVYVVSMFTENGLAKTERIVKR